MIIAIISDIHDNVSNLKKCLNWSLKHNAEKIICCGDVSNIETLSYLSANFPGEIFLVKGNNKLYDDQEVNFFSNIKYYGDIGEIEIDKIKITFCHEPRKIKQIKNNPDFIFYGHTHKPALEKRNNTIIANPGNLANTLYPPSFAVLDTNTKKLNLIILNSI